MVGGALSETVLSTGLRLSLLSGKWTLEGGRGLSDAAFRWLSLFCRSQGQFSGNSAQNVRWEHCKIPRWRCWFGGSQPPRWRWKFCGRNNTTHFDAFAVQYDLKTSFGDHYTVGRLAGRASCPWKLEPLILRYFYSEQVMLENLWSKMADTVEVGMVWFRNLFKLFGSFYCDVSLFCTSSLYYSLHYVWL